VARRVRLDELGFVWDTRGSGWETMFTELKRYRDEHGHCNVLARWRENSELAGWVPNFTCSTRSTQVRAPSRRLHRRLWLESRLFHAT
jgi:hypothetical protein